MYNRPKQYYGSLYEPDKQYVTRLHPLLLYLKHLIENLGMHVNCARTRQIIGQAWKITSSCTQMRSHTSELLWSFPLALLELLSIDERTLDWLSIQSDHHRRRLRRRHYRFVLLSVFFFWKTNTNIRLHLFIPSSGGESNRERLSCLLSLCYRAIPLMWQRESTRYIEL